MTSLSSPIWHRPPDADPALATIEPIDRDIDRTALDVDDAQAIVATLRNLAMRAEPVTLYPAGGSTCVSGRLVRLQEPGLRWTVQAEPAAVPLAGPALLVAAPEELRVQFIAHVAWQRREGCALEATADAPHAIVRQQRRRFVRVEAPLGPSLRAEFYAEGKKRVMVVDDLSLGGVGLRGPLREHRDLMTKLRLERVRLELGGARLPDLRLDVCSHRSYRSFLAGEQVHFGCRFVDLAARDRATLERVLHSLEQERRIDTTF
ncbi:PilZ domain-containing protein [Pseudorhodoferax sp. Leaf274]|uniref:PilZ domain-containing protein n=1 Tax=Pseudorhodoferax sp. Leaf274 TaxID=1736318 RepID=UPI00138F1BB9|nr:PilZ domain-containing protein [Pseudorhodoferax sp. Leaf274]